MLLKADQIANLIVQKNYHRSEENINDDGNIVWAFVDSDLSLDGYDYDYSEFEKAVDLVIDRM